MSLIRWEPFQNIERLFDENIGPVWTGNFGLDLAADVYEKDNNVVAEMQLPGVDPKKVEVTFESDHHLRIAGAREEKQETDEKQYYSREIRHGSFERVVRLPVPVDQSQTKASYESGVLRVTMPKKEQLVPEKVKVEVEEKEEK